MVVYIPRVTYYTPKDLNRIWYSPMVFQGIGTYRYPAAWANQDISRNFEWLETCSPEQKAKLIRLPGHKPEWHSIGGGNLTNEWKSISKKCRDYQLIIPESFERFVLDESIRDRIPDYNGKSVWLCDLRKISSCLNSWFLLFMADYQGCGFHYLWLTREREPWVVLGPNFRGPYQDIVEDAPITQVPKHFVLCAESFTEFIYYLPVLDGEHDWVLFG